MKRLILLAVSVVVMFAFVPVHADCRSADLYLPDPQYGGRPTVFETTTCADSDGNWSAQGSRGDVRPAVYGVDYYLSGSVGETITWNSVLVPYGPLMGGAPSHCTHGHVNPAAHDYDLIVYSC